MTKAILKSTRNVLIMLVPLMIIAGVFLWHHRGRLSRRGASWIKTPEQLNADFERMKRQYRFRVSGGYGAIVIPLAKGRALNPPEKSRANAAEWVQFDHDNDRFAERSTWVADGDALLVWDRNADGRIDGGHELFGYHTFLADGNSAADGLAALRDLDDSGDGVIDARDASWSGLRLWRDENRNGIVDGEERLVPLEEAGIVSLLCNRGTCDEAVSFDRYALVGRYRKSDGESGVLAEVGFLVDPVKTNFLDAVDLDPEVEKLPNISGYGRVPDLRQAIMLDVSGELGNLLRKFLAEEAVAERKNIFDELYYRWLGVWSLDARSLGSGIEDARMVYALKNLASLPDGADGTVTEEALDPGMADKIEKKFIHDRNQSYSYLSLCTHYRDWYNKSTKALHAARKNDAPVNLESLLDSLHEAYDREDLATVADFLQVMDCFDRRGRECVAALRENKRFVPGAADAFSRFVAVVIGK